MITAFEGELEMKAYIERKFNELGYGDVTVKGDDNTWSVKTADGVFTCPVGSDEYVFTREDDPRIEARFPLEEE